MRKCPFCAEEVQDEAVLCRFCNRRLPKALPPMRPPGQPLTAEEKARRQKQLLVVSWGLLLLPLALWLGAAGGRYLLPEGSPFTSASERRNLLGPGSDVTLRNRTGNVVLATSPAAMERLEQFTQADDQPGVAELVTADLVFLVKDGTKAKVIQRGDQYAEVRVLEGGQTGRAGWVRETEFE